MQQLLQQRNQRLFLFLLRKQLILLLSRHLRLLSNE
jgi:hypothetical protein